ncbi:BOS complex subunit ncln-like [Uloborus diversus]|uniref:BOS complex subunit ncln-like n=1 Tax=Uloborus diversus TaxID=327109 RepID=UPI0024090209|nr:BOS complex subunit ncln-like [Uloborus diversus]
MYFEEADSVFEFFRGNFLIYSLMFVPLIIVISPITPVLAAHEFTVYRMQHFDLHGTPHGCRSSVLNMEAKTLYTTPYTRRCVVARLSELTFAHYQDVINQNAGGLLILIPRNLSSLPATEHMVIMELEKHMLEDDVTIPIYFTYETEEILDMYYSMEQTSPLQQKTRSAAEEIPSSITSSGYQLVVSGPQPKAQADTQIVSIQGKLCGFGVEEQLPTVAIVAHYDAYGIAPGLSYGSDSNGSGVAALLELARLLSRLYTNSRTHPRFNLLFLLSGGGKFNYQGTKKWIEDNIDSSDGSLLPDALYTLCLDSIGDEDNLYLHVSKPPKEGSSGDIFYKELQWAAAQSDMDVNISLIHKRINLADELLSWEHERFSIRRLPAFTLSHLQSPRSLRKTTILDTRKNVNVEKLARNVKIIAEALARHMYNISGETLNTGIFSEGLSIQKEYLQAWIDQLSSQPRSAQTLVSGTTKHPLISSLEQAMMRYLKDVKFSIFRPDKREPELMFYEPVSTMMNAYRVKPAIFDLFLAMVIGSYLGIVYLLITNFYRLERLMKTYSISSKAKQS